MPKLISAKRRNKFWTKFWDQVGMTPGSDRPASMAPVGKNNFYFQYQHFNLYILYIYIKSPVLTNTDMTFHRVHAQV